MGLICLRMGVLWLMRGWSRVGKEWEGRGGEGKDGRVGVEDVRWEMN